jgi:spore germination cell wall hydrolase CwlJ-like protein
MHRGGRWFAALLLLAGLGVSAHAALKAIAAQGGDPPAIVAAPTGYEAQDHFPGAALLYADDPAPTPLQAPPAAPPAATPGATGTIPLPAAPVPAGAFVDPTLHPAPPFSLAHAAAIDRGRALECLTAAVYYEAATEPAAGQAAVAQVILNRVRHPAFPHTICGVVYQGSEHAGCQFSFACDGSMGRALDRAYWTRAAGVAAAALAGHVEGEVGMATHYHTFAVTPAWNRQLIMTAAIGRHFFHRWAGWWGTPAAFSAVYRGGEPVPGPHPRTALPEAAPLALPTPTLAAVTVAKTPAATIQPAYAESGAPKATPSPAADSGALPESTILDKWKGTGQPLR